MRFVGAPIRGDAVLFQIMETLILCPQLSTNQEPGIEGQENSNITKVLHNGASHPNIQYQVKIKTFLSCDLIFTIINDQVCLIENAAT